MSDIDLSRWECVSYCRCAREPPGKGHFERNEQGAWMHAESVQRALEQLRGELSLAEEGLANYAQEVEAMKRDIESLAKTAGIEATENERLRKTLEDIASGEIGINLCIRYAERALAPAEPQSGLHPSEEPTK